MTSQKLNVDCQILNRGGVHPLAWLRSHNDQNFLQELKKSINKELGYPSSSQRLYLQNQELQDEAEMKDLISRQSICYD